MRWMTFGGKALSDFNVFWDGSQVFTKPPKTFEKYSIPGRNGDLVVSRNRYDNIIVPFSCFIRKDFERNFSNLMDYLNSFEGYQRLETSTEPEIYREAVFHSAVVPETGSFNKSGKFTLEFDCKPQEFFKSGENGILVSAGTTKEIQNPTYQKAKPLLVVETSSASQSAISVNLETIVITALTQVPLYIDCETMDCYTINQDGTATNKNDRVTMPLNFIYLYPGINQISTDNLNVTVIPRWWKV